MAESFGELLRRFRIAASLTQEALAERCRISPNTIAAIEQGRRTTPRLSTVRLIAEALELSAADRAVLARAASRGDPDLVADPADTGPTAPGLTAVGPTATGGAGQVGWGDRYAGNGGGGRARGALPTPITPLFGRHADAAAVGGQLASERLVTLVGPGGIGKTRLALAVASGTADKFAGGTFWADLGAVGDPGGVPVAVLTALGAAEQPAVEIRDQLLAALPGDRALLVIDNCEHVLDEAAAVIAGLLAHPAVTVLATSREPLAVPGEIRWQVPALAVPPAGPPGSAAALAGFDSVQLFAERASRADRNFTVSDAVAAAIARVCRRLGGIPLAIELVAAQIGGIGAGQLAAELDERIPLATAPARGVPGRHTTLWASIDWSYRLLTAAEQAAFRCLACFTGSFTAQAFAAVAQRTVSQDSAVTVPTLYRLADKSLVSPEAGAGRYHVLDTIRAFAAERAGEAAELTAIRDAHADHYAAWVAGLGATEARDEVLDLIETDYPNVRAALTWSIETRSPRAAAIAAALGDVWQQRGHYHDALVLGGPALETAAGHDRALWARAVASLSMARLLGGDVEFLDAVSRAETIARDAGDRRTEGWCQLARGTRPPFDGALLVSAHEIGSAGVFPSLATLGAIFLAYGGTEPDREGLLGRADEFGSRLDNATLGAARKIAWADSLIERGRMAEALDLAVPATRDGQVMPTVRLLGIGRTLQVAFHRRDPSLADLAIGMSEELSHVWPAVSPRLLAAWTVFGNLLQMWSGLLRGDRPPAPDLRTLRRANRMVMTPSAVRTICRAAADRGDRLEPGDVAMATTPPAAGSLMAASLTAVGAAHATLDGDLALAERCWSDVLSAAAPQQYLLLVCDALEGLGYLAARRADATRAGQLLGAAGQCREEAGYRYRFGFEQELVDRAWQAVGSRAAPEPAPSWQAAVAVALGR